LDSLVSALQTIQTAFEECRHDNLESFETRQSFLFSQLTRDSAEFELSQLVKSTFAAIQTAKTAISKISDGNANLKEFAGGLRKAKDVTNRLIVPFRSYHDFVPSKIIYPRASNDSLAQAQALHKGIADMSDIVEGKTVVGASFIQDLLRFEELLSSQFPDSLV
jgi:hypothetical protein